MEKINIAQLLKDCPKGMELDCAILDNVVFEKIDFSSSHHPIIIRRTDSNKTIHLTKYGQYSTEEDYKCIIFPKGKTTWEGFVPPREFKDGDIVVNNIGKPFILKFYDLSKDNVCTYCGINCWDNFELSSEYWTCARDIRYATEEEKAKLFDAIKANGYKWDEETKTLEELPKFKAGDRIQNKYNGKLEEAMKGTMKKASKWMREEFYTSKDRDGHNILVSASWDNVEELINDFEKQMEE